MRILFVSTLSHIPQRASGANSCIDEMAHALQERGHETAVLCALKPRGPLFWRTRIQAALAGEKPFIEDHRLGYATYRGYDPINGIPEAIERFQPEVAVAEVGQTSRTARALIEAGLPCVAYLHDTTQDTFAIDPFIHPRLLYISNSLFTQSFFRERNNLLSEVIRPLVHPERYRVHSTREVVLHLNPSPRKGIDITLKLAQQRPKVPFWIVDTWGLDRRQRADFRARTRRLSNVRTFATTRDPRPLYRRSRLICAPSQWIETWGRMATEAHLSGIPVLASLSGGLPESVGPGGLLLPPDAPIEHWLTALDQLWSDPTAYAQIAARSLAYAERAEIQPKHIVERFLESLNRVQATPAQGIGEQSLHPQPG
ncbi:MULTISPECIES: glycosyltransferase [unclassified Halorhodospira]|uniref:glycosyltransferase n=1 Tax=unclassified Halorhodospira TaxID=2626748 RepID=UPI001EE8ED2B|nr:MULTISPECIES: glycosyltransferase [unclassified Halorhodospira]MCG5537291.1 glycosyltransferase [Halorhodospira sp. 9622]MCG5540145.1 glycosyltransferase [Halorhodospira sp. M39old]MCG5545154.1 glycosyltransferase [Halorhodospira sp. M38]